MNKTKITNRDYVMGFLMLLPLVLALIIDLFVYMFFI